MNRLSPVKTGVLVLIGAVVCTIVCVCSRGVRIETYRDKIVIGGEIVTPFNLIAVHASRPQYLIVNGRFYKNVRGLEPYYLTVPQIDSILFVTTDSADNQVIHIVNLSTKEDVPINIGKSGFGWNIGSTREVGSPGTDYVESVQSNRVAIAKRSYSWKEILVLNLREKRAEHLETFEYDRDGKLTNQWTKGF